MFTLKASALVFLWVGCIRTELRTTSGVIGDGRVRQTGISCPQRGGWEGRQMGRAAWRSRCANKNVGGRGEYTDRRNHFQPMPLQRTRYRPHHTHLDQLLTAVCRSVLVLLWIRLMNSPAASEPFSRQNMSCDCYCCVFLFSLFVLPIPT